MAVATPIQIRFERFDGALGIAPARPPRVVAPGEKVHLLGQFGQVHRPRPADVGRVGDGGNRIRERH